MAFIELFADSELSPASVKSTIESLFPSLKPFQWDPRAGEVEPVGFDTDNPHQLLFDIYKEDTRAEFWWRITIYRIPDAGNESRAQLLAYTLSAKYHVRMLVAYTLPANIHYPYSVLVYIDGNCYLGDDATFDYTGDENSEELIKIIQPYSLPVTRFDAFGEVLQYSIAKTPGLD